MRLINLIPLQEIDFRNQAAFDAYNKQHKLRPDTKVNIAGKNTTAGQAAQSSTPVKGTSVFGGDDKEKSDASPIPKAKPGSFLDAFQKINPGYDANKTLADFSKESEADLDDTDSDPEDRADHEEYVKSATEWFNKVATTKPTVKPGDLVKVNMKSNGKEGIGKIVKPITMQGNYGFMGQVAPDKQPGWKIDAYTEKNIGTSKKPIDVNGKKYYYQGTLYYPQHEEGDKEAFSKLGGGDNKKSTEDKPKQKLSRFPGGKEYPTFGNPLEGFPTEYKELLKKLQRSNDSSERYMLINKMNVIRKKLNLIPLTGGDKKSTEDKPKQKLVFPDAKKKPVEEPFDGGVDVLDTVEKLLPPGTGFTDKKTGNKILVKGYKDNHMFVSHENHPNKILKWPLKQFFKLASTKRFKFHAKSK